MRALAVAGALALVAAPAGARAATQAVTVEFSAFAPSQIDALPGETVTWTNASQRTHTVTGAGAFASGQSTRRCSARSTSAASR